MGESISSQYRGKVTRVYLGEGKAEPSKSPETTKADTLYSRHMQEIFDVVAPEMIAERVEAAKAQTEIAVETAEELQKKSTARERYKKHKDFKRYVRELDTEVRGREMTKRLDRMLIYSILGGASAAMDFVGDYAGEAFFDKRDALITLPKGKELISLKDGNREAMKAGWEMLTDTAIGAFSDKSVQLTTNRSDAEFISPLSKGLSKIGTIISTFALNEKQKHLKHYVNALINPSTIEAGIRSLAVIPVGGAVVERVYNALNKKLDNDFDLLTVGFDVSTVMLAAKVKHSGQLKESTSSQ